MSEFTNKQNNRINDIINFTQGLINKENGGLLYKKYQKTTDSLIPKDIIIAFDIIMQQKPNLIDFKIAINKILNIFYQSIQNYPSIKPEENNFIDLLTKDNLLLTNFLQELKSEIKDFNKNKKLLESEVFLQKLKTQFESLLDFSQKHYTLKENLLFPILESNWEHYRCIQVMWSFHDDIKNNLKTIIQSIETQKIDLKSFNKTIADVFFNMYAIAFREDKILFPEITESISKEKLQDMLEGSIEIGFGFLENINIIKKDKQNNKTDKSRLINLGTGTLSIEQLNLIFDHLPVDITYVDENDEVKFFSDPPHRIFSRTTAIIGRKVHNCHPPESVHIVEKIVEAFRKGEKDDASFWIPMGKKFILIKYFAVRDKNNVFKGTLEVSQEISEIQKLQGVKKLLDWE